ncbi:MAG: hypothetical protein HRT77_09830 [Halioglobus sp.]|nr:hypothetical protein [Halioglobus sp.]
MDAIARRTTADRGVTVPRDSGKLMDADNEEGTAKCLDNARTLLVANDTE